MMSLIDQSAAAPGCSIRASPIWLSSASHCRYSSRTPFNSSDLFIDTSFGGLCLLTSSLGVYHGKRSKIALICSSSVKPFPMAFGDDLNGSVDHFDGGLVVNCVRGALDTSRPSFCVRQGVLR